MTTTLITGGTVVNATGTATADVLVDGETIVGRAGAGLAAARDRSRRRPWTPSWTPPGST